MKEKNKLILDFYEQQKKYGYLETINLSRNAEVGEEWGYSLNIILFKFPYCVGAKKICLSFNGVRNLKINEIDSLLKLYIKITDISKNQMEKINYKVEDVENNIVSLYCESFKFEIVE